MRKLSILLLLLGLIPSMVLASGYALYEMNAAAHGQGHAFITRVKDASAVWYNPAALSRLEGDSVYASATWISTSGDFTSLAGNGVQLIGGNFLPANFYYAHPINDRWAFGAGFYQPFGLSNEWPADSQLAYVSKLSKLHTYFFTPSVSLKLNNNISIGGGFDVVYADATLDRLVSLQPFAPYTFEGSIEGNKTAFGFNVGALLQTDINLDFAVTYKYKVDLNFEGDATFKNVPSPVSPLFPDQKVDFTIPLPSQLAFGVSSTYESVSFEGNLILTQWDRFDSLHLNYESNTPLLPDQTILRNYDNSWSLRLGMEYKLSDQVALRGGYVYDLTPVPDRAVDPFLPDGTRNAITFGAGYSSDRWSFDVGYMYLHFADRNSPPDNYVSPLAAGAYTSKASLLAFGFGYKY